MKIIHMVAGKPLSSEVYHQGCIDTLEAQVERVDHFLHRMDQRGDDPRDVLINFVNVDDPLGSLLIEHLMPGQEAMWQGFRAKGATPYGRGLARRREYQEMLDAVNPEAGKKLRAIQGKAIIVVDHGVVEVFDFS